ncbi:MAG TPA: site-specific integrase [Candidatus Acidoferrales bacterium]|nr:site-specific integrase [Candidatus Acidoferrales bacterium]
MAASTTPDKETRARGTGHLRKIGKYWHVYFYTNGRHVRESSRSESRMVAEKLLLRRLGETRLGLIPAQQLKKLKYESIRQSFLDDYTTRGHRSLIEQSDGTVTVCGLNHLDDYFRGRAVISITTDLLRGFIKQRQGEGAEPSTINRNLALLRRMFFLAKHEGKVPSGVTQNRPMKVT